MILAKSSCFSTMTTGTFSRRVRVLGRRSGPLRVRVVLAEGSIPS
jgi:hypothetical protein